MTRTAFTFRDQRYWFPSEKDAYLGAVNTFLTVKPALLTEASRYLRKDRVRASLFAPVSDPRFHQPARLANGW